MSRLCHCHRKCRHLVRTGVGDPLVTAEAIRALRPVLGMLIDAADNFDAETLTFDPECPTHGDRPVANSECICPGTRYSALEFVQALGLDVVAASSREEPREIEGNRQEGQYRRRADLRLVVSA